MYVNKVTLSNKQTTKKIMGTVSFEDIKNAKKDHKKKRHDIKQQNIKKLNKKTKNKEKFNSEFFMF